MAMTLDNIKVLLSLTEDDSQDEILAILLLNASRMICVYLGIDELPSTLDFVAEDMAIVKYRKLGAEGIKQEKIDVLSTTYVTNDLEPYKAILNQYKDNNSLGGKRLRML